MRSFLYASRENVKRMHISAFSGMRKRPAAKICFFDSGNCGKLRPVLCGKKLFCAVVVEFSEVKTAANERKLEKNHF